jgi:hypothetical protein
MERAALAAQREREDNKENAGLYSANNARRQGAFVPKLNLGFVPVAPQEPQSQHATVLRRSTGECSVSSQSSVDSGNDFSTHADHMDDGELKSILRRQYKKVCIHFFCVHSPCDLRTSAYPLVLTRPSPQIMAGLTHTCLYLSDVRIPQRKLMQKRQTEPASRLQAYYFGCVVMYPQ